MTDDDGEEEAEEGRRDPASLMEKLRNAFIVLFIASQFVLLISYYVGDDLFDERFAWRMFSPIRVTPCAVAFSEERGGVVIPVRLGAEIPMPWSGLMRRARISVIEGYARYRCERMAGEAPNPVLHASVACEHPDGEVRVIVDPPQNICATSR